MSKKILLILYVIIIIPLFSQDVELNRINAKEEFKWGVKFYNQALYEKAVFSFERSISFDSTDLLTHEWLGRAYFMKGDVDAAIDEWSLLEDKDSLPLWLKKNIEIISAERGVINKLYKPEEWVPLYRQELKRPTSILTMKNGVSAVVSFMGNKIELINSNGAIVDNFTGGFEPFNRPYDIIQDNNNGFIVTEFMGDKISFINDLGIKTKSINPEESPLAGPGYLTKDNNGYFYVSDWGNRRVCKFDMEGNLILTIEGGNLKRPSGILCLDNELYVADAVTNSLYKYDSSGNFIETLISKGLEGPEGLSLKNSSTIFIADTTELKEYDLNRRVLSTVSDLEGKASKITKGVIDVNGNTLTTDFNRGEFYSLTDITTLYGGLYIVIDRVISSNFPKMEVELQVYNRLGQPLIGLDNTNFLVSENSKIVGTRDIIFKGYSNNILNMGLILDLSSDLKEYLETYYDLTSVIKDEMYGSDNLSLFKAGQLPSYAGKNSEVLDAISNISETEFTTRDGVDLSIKMAASTILNSRAGRVIVLVTDGISREDDFVKYSLSEIRDFLVNNRITLSVLYLEEEKNKELEYLVNETLGSSRYLFAGKGAKGLTDIMRSKKSGFYVLSYDSLKNIDNGEVFTTVEVEVNYIRKSGRSESGFFVPVKVIK